MPTDSATRETTNKDAKKKTWQIQMHAKDFLLSVLISEISVQYPQNAERLIVLKLLHLVNSSKVNNRFSDNQLELNHIFFYILLIYFKIISSDKAQTLIEFLVLVNNVAL